MKSATVHALRPRLPEPTKSEYPDAVKKTARPFRLWDSREKHMIPHRCYMLERSAHDAAYRILRWNGTMGETIEVIDIRVAAWRGTYVRRIDHIQFDPNRNPR